MRCEKCYIKTKQLVPCSRCEVLVCSGCLTEVGLCKKCFDAVGMTVDDLATVFSDENPDEGSTL
jgi:hypothetical protein